MKSESSRSPPQIGQAKTDSRISKTTIKPASTNKKSRKTEVKLEESSKAFEDECNVSNSKPLNGKARSKVSKQSSAESSPKTQASKAQNKIPKSSKGASPSLKPTNREEPSEKPEDIVDYKSPSSKSKPAKSNVMSKPSKQIGQVNKFKETEIKKEVSSEEESELEKRTTKSEANKEKRKSRSRVKRKINASSDSDDNKKSDLALALDEDEKPSKKTTEDGQSRKIRAVEDGGSIVAPENELLAQKLDIVGSKNPIGLGDDAESDNTIKGEDEERILERTIESDEDGHVSQNNSESMGKIEQEPNGSKAESTSPKRMIDSVEDDDDLSSLEDDEPRKKKRRTGKASAKPVNKKTVNRTANSKTVNNKNIKTDNKTTVEKNDKRIKNLKSLISQCGVRKNWAKEFADCRTDSSKIGKLKEILIDLGVEGRPTLEKCKKVRKRRELEAELGAMDVDNIISDDVKETRKARASRGIFNTLRHRSSRVIQSSPEYDDASSDSSDSSEDKHSDFE